jgi:hypothetical protein
MFTYILCEFEYGYSGQFYQEVDSNGFVVRMTDLDGNTLNLSQSGEPNFIPYGANVVDANPQKPSWAN